LYAKENERRYDQDKQYYLHPALVITNKIKHEGLHA